MSSHITVCQKKKKDFVKMSIVNVIVTKDQVLEEETRRDNIARKTIQPGFVIQSNCSFLYGQKGLLKEQGK